MDKHKKLKLHDDFVSMDERDKIRLEFARKMIAENINLLDYYDLEETLKKVIKTLVKKETGFYPDHTLPQQADVFDFEQPVAYNVARFKEFIDLNFEGSIENYRWVYENHYLINTYFFNRHSNGKKDSYSFSNSYGHGQLFFFLRMVINKGKADKDLTQSNKIADYWKQQNYNAVLPLREEGEPGEAYMIECKWFNNGRLDIKGLKPEHDAMVHKMIEYIRSKRQLKKVDKSKY